MANIIGGCNDKQLETKNITQTKQKTFKKKENKSIN